MPQVKQFLQDLGLTVKRERGEYRTQCPWCGDDNHLHVNAEDGQIHCQKCSEPGKGKYGPYELAKKITGKTPAEVNAILDGFGLNSRKPSKAPPKKYTPFKAKTMTGSEIKRFCKAKSLDPDALHNFKPRIAGDIVLLPASDTKTLVGQLRCHIDGDPITLGSGKQEKYPMASGGRHGLLGVGWLQSIEYNDIWFCEAWRDALAAMSAGAVATASTGGASKWDNAWLSVFKGKNVYICMDADRAGNRASARAAEAILPVAKQAFLVDLPYPIVEKHGRDLCDYLGDGGDIADLPATEYKPPPPDEIILANDHPDTLAKAFRENSDVRYHWNSVDEWSLYHNDRYQEIPNTDDLESYLRRFILTVKVKRKVQGEDGAFKTTTQRADKKMKTPAYINSAIKWLRDSPAVYLRPGQKSPCSLDETLDPKYIIPVKNGLLDWPTYPYTLHPPTHKYYTLQYLPYNWEGEQESEMWANFMLDSTGMDEALHDLLQQWAGYCLMRHNQDEQRFMIVYGEAMTGKSVYADVLTHLIGKENIATVPLDRFDDPHMVTQTYGKMLNITDESETSLEESIESNLKHYTGGTMYSFKKMYRPPFSAYPTAKIMIVTNHLPAFKDTSDGVWRRLLIVPFDHIVPKRKEIKGLAKKIIATEMPGVLAWALKGSRKLEKYGFVVPDKCTENIAEYRREAIAEMTFLEENFEAYDPEEIDGRIGCGAFRTAYEDWCKEQGIKPKGMRKLSKTMKKVFPLYTRVRGREGAELGYFYYGIKIQRQSIYYKA